MADKLEAIIDSVAELSVLELSELIKALEEKFGVEAAAAMAFAPMPGGGDGEAAEDEGPTSFDVIIKEHGSSKIGVIKIVKEIAGLGLKEAKALVDGCPTPIKEGVPEDEANKVKEQLEAAGATVEIKGAA